MSSCCHVFFFFFFNDTATTEIYTLSLHDALPIYSVYGIAFSPNRLLLASAHADGTLTLWDRASGRAITNVDRKSTRLNSSHSQISYAVFCLKKKKNKRMHSTTAVLSSIVCSDIQQ